ncbi:hypothetical protein Caci_7399 [Catenulispora acidiphila DSM 44928]|uniref:Uncharacterized protein n=1 Tax=Catenulispora acidiphila (strain DSM 44928 / JCM 14897 / NBRC 102108 / NRRL B-24433 / ID139908) TaxID=479433 RepID=C7Q9Q6_CATAD|nr:hypothetical protein [Catenulispora acidiphila]ACU76225.1 hypothetical protein Caci_7399 [Catenulispora acidiphila DSM 44928]
MNRIEQVAAPTPTSTPTPAPQPRLPRARRGGSGLAVAMAALAVPLMPGTAFGATSSTGGGGVARTEVPHARHHLHHFHHGPVLPDPGVMTLRAWTASGWSLTVPNRDNVPWLAAPAQPALPIDHPRPVVLPDGTHGEIAEYRVPHASSVPPAGARSRVLPQPLVPFAVPSNTKQMTVPSQQAVDIPNGVANHTQLPSENAVAASLSASPSCQRRGYPISQDRYMVAHLRPAADPMDVAVSPHRTACAARVDYLSQARA